MPKDTSRDARAAMLATGDEEVDRSTEKNKLGTWALILAITSIFALVLPPILSLTLGTAICVAAVVLGIMGVRAAAAGLATTRAQAFAGLLLGGVAAVLYAAALWAAYLIATGAISVDDLG